MVKSPEWVVPPAWFSLKLSVLSSIPRIAAELSAASLALLAIASPTSAPFRFRVPLTSVVFVPLSTEKVSGLSGSPILRLTARPVSYTHLTLPTILLV